MATKPKREPTLADLFLAFGQDTEMHQPHFFETTRDHLMQSHRFVFDDEATQYVGDMIRTMPRIIADAQDFAIPPFKQTWIEFSSRILYEAVTGLPAAHNSDTRVGYLITGPIARVIALGNDNDAAVLPLQYKLFQPWSLQQELDFCSHYHLSRHILDVMFWGESANTFIHDADKEGLRALRSNHSLELCCNERFQYRVMDQLSTNSAGDLRTIIAMLLFLNRTSNDLYINEVGHAQKMVRTRPTPLLKHSVIKLKLNPLPRLRKLCAGPGVMRRLHDVRGHYCHNKEARFSGCMHDWIETKPLHWECSLKCGGLRWWRNEHKRGNADKGTVTSHYQVEE